MKEERCPTCSNILEFIATVVESKLFKCHTCNMNVWLPIDKDDIKVFNEEQ